MVSNSFAVLFSVASSVAKEVAEGLLVVGSSVAISEISCGLLVAVVAVVVIFEVAAANVFFSRGEMGSESCVDVAGLTLIITFMSHSGGVIGGIVLESSSCSCDSSVMIKAGDGCIVG